MIILGIETSCDDTGIALFDQKEKILLANFVASQFDIHEKFGGIVPELASRNHLIKLAPLVKEALKKSSLELKKIGAIAYTCGPGLLGPLIVGCSFAKTLGFMLKIPTIPVHHLEGHFLSPLLEQDTCSDLIKHPYLCLIISGGHTQLYKIEKFGDYHLLGETLDDAVGEAFDKIAKLLDLPFPGAPELEKLAGLGQERFFFPRPMCRKHNNLNFSFSGLKTSVVNTWIKVHKDKNLAPDIAHSFQEAAIDTLIIKCKKAIVETNIKSLVVCGGVSKNKRLKEKLMRAICQESGTKLFLPREEYCTDNGAMIALAGSYRIHQVADNKNISSYPRLSLKEYEKMFVIK